MRSTTYVFEEVRQQAYKRGTCPVCHKTVERSTTFTQTINPFNKNAAGEVKSPREIRDELRAEAAAWKAEPAVHARCES